MPNDPNKPDHAAPRLTARQRRAADWAERLLVTSAYAVFTAMVQSGLDVAGVVQSSSLEKLGYVGLVAAITFVLTGLRSLVMPRLSPLLDGVMRVVLTFVEFFLAGLAANALELGDFADLTVLGAAGSGAVAAAFSTVKNLVAAYFVGKQTGSLLPAKLDPIAAPPAAA